MATEEQGGDRELHTVVGDTFNLVRLANGSYYVLMAECHQCYTVCMYESARYYMMTEHCNR